MTRRCGLFFSAATGWRLLAGVCLTALAVASPTAMAQSTTASPPAAATQPQGPPDSGALEEVVVTTRFARENIQVTPMAVTAQTNTQLEAANVTNLSTLGAVVPNLWTVPGDSQSAGTPRISMRGVQQGSTSSLAAAPAVAIYSDDVYQATTAGSELDLTDIDHIEVNRGPQSTLSGNASIGGSIKIFTKDPVGDGSGYFSVDTGSYSKLGASGAADMALSPTLSMRVSGDYQHQDGFVNRLDFTCEMNKLGTPGLAGSFPEQPGSAGSGCVTGKLGGINHETGQIKFRWQPTDKLDVLVTGRIHRENDEETPEISLAYIPNPSPNPNGTVQTINNATQQAYGIQLGNQFLPPPGNRYSTYATDCRPSLNLPQGPGLFSPSGFCYPQGKTADKNTYSAKVHYDISDDVHMTAIGAYTDYSNAFTQNGDQSPLGYVVSHFENTDRQETGELRFDGMLFDDKLSWNAGGFILRVKGFQNTFAGFLASDSYAFDSATIQSQSGFFHLDYNLTDKWRVSGGARYTNGDISYNFNHPPLLTVAEPFKSPESRGDWLLSTDYKITDDLFVYANAASGSRPPGVTTIINTVAQFLPTPGENLISYEVGMKTEFFDHHLRSNLSAFYTDYKLLSTLQVGDQCLGQPGTATWFPTSASCNQFADKSFYQWQIPIGIPATIDGFEWDVTALPTDHLRIDWTGGYNHYKSGVTTVGAPGYLFPGNHVQPDWNMHANASYDIRTPVGAFTPRVDWSWQSQQDFDPASSTRAPLPIYTIAPYSVWNAQISYQPDDSKWSGALSVTNLNNKFYYYQILQGSLNAQARVAEPREFSLTIRREF